MKVLWILTLIFGSVLASENDKPNNRIIDGILINITQAPWAISIHTQIKRGNEWQFTRFVCGGSIIGRNEVLTAAHCLPKGRPSWKIMVFRAGSANREKGGSLHNLDYVRYPPLHQPQDASYDFAFARVKESFQFGDSIKPIHIRKFEPESGSVVTVAGWGSTNPKLEPDEPPSKDLRAVNLTLWHKDDCYSRFNVSLCFANYPDVLKCMKNIGEGSDKSGCRGDSGSPIVYRKALVGVLTGGISREEKIPPNEMICNAPSVVNVYNSPVKIWKWIRRMIKESQGIGKR